MSLFIFNAWKTQLNSFELSNNSVAVDVKMNWSDLDEGPSFKMLGLSFSSKLDWVLELSILAYTAFKKIGALISQKFLSSDVTPYLFKKPSNSGWNIVVILGSVLLIAF